MRNLLVISLLILIVLASSCSKKKEDVKINKQSKTDSSALTDFTPKDSQTQKGNELNSAGEENINIINSEDSKNHIDENVKVRGYVVSVVKRENVAYLNFDKKYPKNTFTAVIFAEKFSEFDDLDIYRNQTVEVKGVIKLYRGKPEIIVSSKNQIQTVK